MSRPVRIAAIAALAASSAAVGWAVRGAPAETDRSRPETTRAEAGPDGTLAECRAALAKRDTELRFARRLASGPHAAAEPAGTDAPAPAEERPRGFDGHEWVESPEPVAEAHRRADLRVRIGESLSRAMHLTPEEEAAARDLVCPMLANQRALFSEFGDGRLEEEAFWRSMRDERRTVYEGLERTLGSARWREFQDLGGVPMFGQTMCPRR